MVQWTNDDGLQVPFGQDQARETASIPGKAVGGVKQYMVVDINFDDLPTFTADLNNDGTRNGFSDSDDYIPAGSYITKASLIVETLFAGGTSYNIGTYEQDGTLIDVDSIDAAVALTVIDGANDVVACDGALVGGILSTTLDSYLVVAATGTFTAGKMKLVIEYLQVAP
jgi:hypothetical protein